MQKVLSRQTYGKRTDSHAYNALDQLAECMCNDSCLQAFTYNTQGIRQSTNKAGDVNRSMLEELLQGGMFRHCRRSWSRYFDSLTCFTVNQHIFHGSYQAFLGNTHDIYGAYEPDKAILSRCDIPLAYTPQPF